MLLKKNFFILETVLCIALIKCLLLQYALAGSVTSYYFNLKNRFELEPKGGNPSKGKLLIFAQLNLKPHPIRPNTFVAAFQDVNVELIINGMIERVNLCKDFKKILPSFELPFLIVKTKKTSIFQSVTVSKKDDITSKSMKRLVGIKFQLNEGQLRKTKKTEFTNLSVERTPYGKCRVQYKAKKRADRDGDWWIDTSYFRSYCDDREVKTNQDSEYLKGFCNTENDRKLSFEENGYTIVNFTGNTLTYKELTRNFQGNYYPYKNAPRDKFFQYIDSRLGLPRFPIKAAKVPDFDETKLSEILRNDLYIPVTRRHIADGDSNHLRNIYKAMACESEYYNFFLSMMDYAARCFEGKF